MGAIFLSYAREDRSWAEKLAQVIEGAGHEVWWDRRLGGGEEFSAEIETALDRSDVVLVAWSETSIRSRWVRDEAAVGADRGQLVSVSLDGSVPPMGFRQFHTLDLAGWKGLKRDSRTDNLLRSIESKLGKTPDERHSKVAVARKTKTAGGLWWAISALLIIAAVAAGIFLVRSGDRAGATTGEPRFALAAFTSTPADPELARLATQARESLVHSFSRTGVPLQSTDVSAGRATADFMIGGDFSRNGDKVIANIRLDEIAHGVTVYAHRFEATPEETNDLPERIGAQVNGNLTWAYPMLAMNRVRPLDPTLLTQLLQGTDFTGDTLQAYQNSIRVTKSAPNVAAGQISLAFNTAFVLGDIPKSERPAAVADARRAADRAIALEPGFGDTYAAWCLLHSAALLAQCEDQIREGRKADPDAPFLNTFLSSLLRNVGRIEEAVDLSRLSYAHDSYAPTKIAWMLKSTEYSGDSEGSRSLYQQAARWWPEYRPMFIQNRLVGLMARGDFKGMQRVEKEVGKDLPPNVGTTDAIIRAIASGNANAGRQACAAPKGYVASARCLLGLAALGDMDGAYAIAAKIYPRRIGQTARETERIWLDNPDDFPTEFLTSPAAAPLRRDPRYLPLVEQVGLLAYWRSGRRPDFCRSSAETICKQIFAR